ncbi:MAG: hypothetical protein PHR36_00290 [Patescibacteria group bacterium]|nr:hypothetical protein [Patescibacteria group bacterium]
MKIFCETCQKPFPAQMDSAKIRCEHADGKISSTIESICPDCGEKSSYTYVVRTPVSRAWDFGWPHL